MLHPRRPSSPRGSGPDRGSGTDKAYGKRAKLQAPQLHRFREQARAAILVLDPFSKCAFAACHGQSVLHERTESPQSEATRELTIEPRNLSSRHSAIAQTFVTMGDGHESRGFAGAPDG